MRVVTAISETRAALQVAPRPVGFVPTMGALHEGHISLVRAARERCDTVVMSIFVNPLQFGPHEDFDRYPRAEEADLALAEEEKVDIAFMPSVEEMYPSERSTTVTVGELGTRFEGAVRPGHFDGVATVVSKLFGIVQPDVAFFGQKDGQQLAVIKRIVADLSSPVEVVGCPTVREPDGLALSSRNVYLSPDERRRAASLRQALNAGAEVIHDHGVSQAEARMLEVLVGEVDSVDYAAVVDPDSFDPPQEGGPYLLIVAARLGETRLIDNFLVEKRR